MQPVSGCPGYLIRIKKNKNRYDKLTISTLALKNINDLLDKAQEAEKKNKK